MSPAGPSAVRSAVLLMAYGGPTRLDDVEAYYADIRNGRPPTPELLADLVRRYQAIGGGSPLSGIVEAQRRALESELVGRGRRLPVYAAMRHVEPRIGAVVRRMVDDGIESCVAIPLAPHRSPSSAGYRAALDQGLAAIGATGLGVTFVDSWHTQPNLVAALARATRESLARFADPERVLVLFTAHSLPDHVVSAGPYRRDVVETAELVAARCAIDRFSVAFQSAGRTADSWIGPEVRDEIRRAAEDGFHGVLISPVGFVADHLEVLYDIDIEARAVAESVGLRLERARALNDDPLFIGALADLVVGALPRPGRPPRVGAVAADGHRFTRAPMLIYWETTRACGLACRHCRATAQPRRDPEELTTAEGRQLLDTIASFGQPSPHVVFTGGDPLRRPDLEELVDAATARGIGTSLAPSATPEMTMERLAGLKAAGIQTMSLSIDGSNAVTHDAFRGVAGTFALTLRAAEWAHRVGLPLQINTLVTDETLPDLPAIYELVGRLGIIRWSLFFLISVGRATSLREISPAQSERLDRWLFDRSREAPFAIKTTEATHYRRVAIQRLRAEGLDDAAIGAMPVGRGFGVRDGNGIVFVGHDGAIYPSGFLPLHTGNVRTDDLVTIYRSHPVFTSIRDTGSYKGRCGRCPYATICGGSRARAYAWTGDYLEADPLCPYVPPRSA